MGWGGGGGVGLFEGERFFNSFIVNWTLIQYTFSQNLFIASSSTASSQS